MQENEEIKPNNKIIPLRLTEVIVKEYNNAMNIMEDPT
jgi:hypothetical protein